VSSIGGKPVRVSATVEVDIEVLVEVGGGAATVAAVATGSGSPTGWAPGGEAATAPQDTNNNESTIGFLMPT
jgi:hypothetical protein